jgi:hypothetical protein
MGENRCFRSISAFEFALNLIDNPIQKPPRRVHFANPAKLLQPLAALRWHTEISKAVDFHSFRLSRVETGAVDRALQRNECAHHAVGFSGAGGMTLAGREAHSLQEFSQCPRIFSVDYFVKTSAILNVVDGASMGDESEVFHGSNSPFQESLPISRSRVALLVESSVLSI